MKNLFYVCLVAMLSLGSTGFTTVEENVSYEPYECARVAIVTHDFVMSLPWGDMESASEAADSAYEDCMSW
jgi:hypothetical protein